MLIIIIIIIVDLKIGINCRAMVEGHVTNL